MGRTGCRREAPAPGYTVRCDNGRYLAARLYPRAMGVVCGGGPEGVERLKTWRRPGVVPAVPEEQPPRHHPLLAHLRLVAVVLPWPPNAVRCTLTRCSRSLTRREDADGR
jgi:hypothetical protein